MTRFRGKRKSISAIIGTAIALSIVFTIIIPLFLYMQSLQSLFMQEANRRLQYEFERLNEKLEVFVSLSKNSDGFGRRQLYLVLYNPGILSIGIPAVYIESRVEGLRRLEKSFLVSPGQKLIIPLDFYFSPTLDDEVRAKLVTLRGNSFTSEEPVGLRKLPYMLLITVENMTIGYKYLVEVEVAGSSDYGCVLSEVSQHGGIGENCGTKEEHVLIPYTSTDRDGIAAFMVAPGSYVVRLIVKDLKSRTVFEDEWNIVDVHEHTIIRLNSPLVQAPEKIPVRLHTPSNKIIMIISNSSDVLTIPYMLSLGNQSEPLLDIEVNIAVIEHFGLNAVTISQNKKNITRIIPGETYVDFFIVNIQDNTDREHVKYGGRISFMIYVDRAVGELSGKTYSSNDLISPIATGVITLCRMNMTNVLYCETS